MDWKNTKKIILISLILINIFLYGLNKGIKLEYELSETQIQNIKKVLGDNNIGIYSTLPINYAPMSELELKSDIISFKDSVIYKKLKDNNNEILKLEKDGRITYLIDNVRVLIEGDHFIIDNTDNKELVTITTDTIPFLENILMSLGDTFKNYEFDKEIKSTNSVKYEFREVYEGQKIYDNYVQFTVVDNNLYKIKGKHLKIMGFAGQPQEIISTDMALFTFMSIVKQNKIYDTNEIFINNIDIVYYKDYENSNVENDDKQFVFVPAYRIYTEQGEQPFIINAYTNKLMNY